MPAYAKPALLLLLTFQAYISLASISMRSCSSLASSGAVIHAHFLADCVDNLAPVLEIQPANQNFAANEDFTFNLDAATFSDDYPDAQNGRSNLSYTSTLANDAALPAWIVFDASGLGYSGTVPGDICPQELGIKLIATDECGLSVSCTFNLVIQNQTPGQGASLSDQQLGSDRYIEFTQPANSFVDPEGSTVIYTSRARDSQSLPSWLNFEVREGVPTYWGTTPVTCYTSMTIYLEGSDGCSKDYLPFFLSVDDGSPRVEVPAPNRSVLPESNFSFYLDEATFSDDRSLDELTITASQYEGAALPEWIHFEAANMHFYGTAPNECLVEYHFYVTATDCCNQTAETDFTLSILSESPVLSHSISKQVTFKNNYFELVVPYDVFTVGDGSSIEYSAGTKPSWMNYNATTRTFYGTAPNYEDLFELQIRAKTTCSSTKTHSLTIEVTVETEYPFTGSGTSEAPYLINSATELDRLRYYLGKTGLYFKLNADLDLTGVDWMPIGSQTYPFKHHFDGNGHTISNLNFDRVVENAGLFGHIQDAHFLNLILSDFNIDAQTKAGTLAGMVSGSSVIENIKASGTVNIKQQVVDYYTIAGGLIGLVNAGSVQMRQLSFNGTVTGFQRIGGLIGMMNDGSTLQQSFSEGTVNLASVADTRFAGGLIGVAEIFEGAGTLSSPILIEEVFSRSEVNGNRANAGSTGDVGGLIGLLNSGAQLRNSYACGTVNGPTYSSVTTRGTGGLIGRVLNTATQISAVYASGLVTGSSSVNQIGGLAGSSETTTSNAFWNTETTQQASSAGGGTGLTTAEMQNKLTFTAAGWDYAGETENGSNDVWNQLQGINNEKPYLAFQYNNWNGNDAWGTAANWSKGSVPQPGNDVIVESGNLLVDQSITTGAMHLMPGATAQITSGNLLTAQSVTLGSNKTSTAAFLSEQTTVTANVEQYVARNQWHYFGLPLAGNHPANNFFNKFYLIKNFENRSVDNPWEYLTSTDYLEPGLGYGAWYSSNNDTTVTFSGTLNTGEVMVNTTFSGSEFGWNFISNPYPCTIDWTSGIQLSNVDNAIYLWDPSLNEGEGNYASYVNGAGTNGQNQYIPPMQAFFVKASATGSVIFTNAAKTTSTATFKSAEQQAMLRLRLSDENGFSDETVVRIHPDATMHFDGVFDAYKLKVQHSRSPQIYSMLNRHDYSVNTVQDLNEQTIIPLELMIKTSGMHTLTLDETFRQAMSPVLMNKHNEILAHLNTESYHFNADAGENIQLLLTFTTAVSVKELSFDQLIIRGGNGNITIDSQGNVAFDVSVYNLNGQKVSQAPLNKTGTLAIPVNRFGMYLLRIRNIDGNIMIAKVVVND